MSKNIKKTERKKTKKKSFFFGLGLNLGAPNRINVPSGWKSDAQKWKNLIAKFLCRNRDFLFRDWTVVKIEG